MTHKTYQPDKRAGIWIDQHTAYLIEISADHSPLVEKLVSDPVSLDPAAEERAFERLEHSSINKHDKLKKHQEHELQAFFKRILSRIKNEDYLYIIGPGETKNGLQSAIQREGSHFPCKVVGLDAADKISQNQMQQKVREFFTSLRYEDAVRRLSLEV